MNIIKPNKEEATIIIIMISIATGFGLGILSMTREVEEKDEQIEELLSVTDDLLNNFEFPNNTNHPLNLHKPNTERGSK